MNLFEGLVCCDKTMITATHELEIVPIIAEWVVVLSEDRRILASGTPQQILYDTELLIRANVIHEHLHLHGSAHHLHLHKDPGHHDEPAPFAPPYHDL